MAKARCLVGLDVHASKVVAAVIDVETGELSRFRIGGDVVGAAKLCAALPGSVRAAYEAGPTGYGLARELAVRGVQCVVAAPGKIPRASADRIKTDERDAEHLVRLLMAGKLHAVRVPGREEEALRDLVRAREQVRQDLMRCRHRLSKLLLRHGERFQDGCTWGDRHRAWLARVDLGQPAANATLHDAIGAVEALVHRRCELERQITALLPELAVADPRRSAALSARRGHADRGRLVRRDRRLRALQARRAADELCRPGPRRALQRRAAPARRRSPRPAPGTRADCWSKRPGTTGPDRASDASSATARTASRPPPSRSPGPRSSACTASGSGSSNVASGAA